MQFPDLLFALGLTLAASSAIIFAVTNMEAIRYGTRHTLAVFLQVIGLVAILLAWFMVRGLNPGP